MVDIAVIGAGLAGLVCAQQLQQAGYDVVVLEKSRGLGGRMATRRLHQTCVDHGLRGLEVQGELSQVLIQHLLSQQIIQPWIDRVYEVAADGLVSAPSTARPLYSVPDGLTQVAKNLAQGLTIESNQRVTAIAPTAEHHWAITAETGGHRTEHLARAVVLMIPAPQALALLEPLQDECLEPLLTQMRAVDFDPCISAIALYSPEWASLLAELPWSALVCPHDPDLAWVAIDSSKRPAATHPTLIVQSTAAFAQQYLETENLQPVGQTLLHRAATRLISGLGAPEVLQVHRWRYAIPSQPLAVRCLGTATPLPLACGGDWCGGRGVEQAIQSGLWTADYMENQLNGRAIASDSPANRLAQILTTLR